MTEQIEMPEDALAPRGVGPQLRLAREQKGLSIKDLAERTRIPLRQIEKIEAGNFAALPGRAYAVGFARTMAREVGLDEEDIVQQVSGEMNAHVPEQHARRETYEPGDPARAPSRQLVWFSAIAGLILLAGLFVAARQLFWPAAEMPALVDEQAALDAEQAARATPAAANASGAVVFTATDTVWVRFSDAQGNRLMEGELAPGQSFTLPATAQGPKIITGRPDLLTITIGGQAVAPLSTDPITVSNLPVDAASLNARAAPGAVPAAATPGASAGPGARAARAPAPGSRAPSAPPSAAVTPVVTVPQIEDPTFPGPDATTPASE
jgi:cytoskeletal protein RodZ